MGFFNDLGKIVGGITSAIVPGFDTIAKTGIFGNDLAALAGAPQAGAAAAAIASSPNLMATELAPRITVAPTGVDPRLARPIPGLSGRTVQIPLEYLTVLRDAARQGNASPAFIPASTYIPPQAVTALEGGRPLTPLAAIASALPVTAPLTFGERFAKGFLAEPIPPPAVVATAVPVSPALTMAQQFRLTGFSGF